MSDNHSNKQKFSFLRSGFLRSDRGKVTTAIVGASLLIGASFGVPAIADSKVYQHAKLYASETSVGSLVEKAGWGERRGHRHGSRFANMSDEEIEKRVTRVVRHVAIEIDATDEQTAKIATLMSAVAKDMRPLRKDFREAGLEMLDLLTSDNVDREALEKVRTERLSVVDQRSKQVVDALADVAETLTPEQRATLVERMREFRSMRRFMRRG
ncbi:MAG: Spy/CpxP family protein refolding chaperone [Ahrensia sp.]|nr:Spy/CpxP family protein refolding chaperone [Ahrensia sp.]